MNEIFSDDEFMNTPTTYKENLGEANGYQSTFLDLLQDTYPSHNNTYIDNCDELKSQNYDNNVYHDYGINNQSENYTNFNGDIQAVPNGYDSNECINYQNSFTSTNQYCQSVNYRTQPPETYPDFDFNVISSLTITHPIAFYHQMIEAARSSKVSTHQVNNEYTTQDNFCNEKSKLTDPNYYAFENQSRKIYITQNKDPSEDGTDDSTDTEAAAIIHRRLGRPRLKSFVITSKHRSLIARLSSNPKLNDIGQEMILWKFLLYLLEDPASRGLDVGVKWIDVDERAFVVSNQRVLIALWALVIKKPNLKYVTISRSLKLYFYQNIMNRHPKVATGIIFSKQCLEWWSTIENQ